MTREFKWSLPFSWQKIVTQNSGCLVVNQIAVANTPWNCCNPKNTVFTATPFLDWRRWLVRRFINLYCQWSSKQAQKCRGVQNFMSVRNMRGGNYKMCYKCARTGYKTCSSSWRQQKPAKTKTNKDRNSKLNCWFQNITGVENLTLNEMYWNCNESHFTDRPKKERARPDA